VARAAHTTLLQRSAEASAGFALATGARRWTGHCQRWGWR